MAPLSRSLASVYHRAARAWSTGELADRYHAANERGLGDMPAGDPGPDRPISHLSTAIPRTISLVAAAHVLHVLPGRATDRDPDGTALLTHLFSTIDETAAGALHRCQLALDALGRERQDPLATPDEWLPYVYGEAVEELKHTSPDAKPPGLIDHAEQSARDIARAIYHLDIDEPTAPQTIADALSHLLAVCVFADLAAGRDRVKGGEGKGSGGPQAQ